MATYQQIQEHIRRKHGRTVKTCWIADVKASHGLTRGRAPNRRGTRREHPCPPDKRPWIEEALRHFGMV